MVNPKIPGSVIYTYPNTFIPGEHRVAFYLEEAEGHTKPYILFLTGNPLCSPKLYPQETFNLIQNYLKSFNITFEEVEIYLEFNQDSKPSIHILFMIYQKMGRMLGTTVYQLTI